MEDGDLQPYLDLGLRFLEPLAVAVESPDAAGALLEDLGYISPAQVTAFTEAGAGLDMVVEAVEALIAAIEAEDEESALIALAELAIGVGRIFAIVNDFTAKIQANFAGSDLLTQTDILAEIPRKLADYLVVRMLEDHYPTLFAGLLLIGAVELEDVEDQPTSFHAVYRKRTVHWDDLPDVLSDPVTALKDNLADGDAFLYDRLLFFIRRLAIAFGLPVTYDVPDDVALAAFNAGADLTQRPDFDELSILRLLLVSDPAVQLGLELYPRIEPVSGKRTGLGVGLRLGGELEIALGEDFRLVLKIAASLSDSLGVVFAKGQDPQFVNKLFTSNPVDLLASLQFGATISILPSEARSADKKAFVLALPLGRLEIGSASFTFGVEKLADLRVFAETQLAGGVLSFNVGDADGFIGSVAPKDDIRTEFSLGAGVSSNAGFYFTGTSGLSIRLPLHLMLGPVGIEHITLGAEFKASELPLSAAVGLSLKIGPLAAVVEDIGVKATFTSSSAGTGNLGPLDAHFGFKPPNGVGLSVDASVVKGGGYLFLDVDRERVRGRAGADVRRLREPQGDRPHHDADARRLQGLLAAGHHHGRVRDGHPARLRLHADRGRRPARPQPHDEAAAAGRGRPHRARSRGSCSRRTSSPTRRGSSATCARSSRRRRAPSSSARWRRSAGARRRWSACRSGSSSRSRATSRSSACSRSRCPSRESAIIVLQVNFVGAIEFDTQARLLLRGALRLARAVHHDRGRDGGARRVRRRRRTSCCRSAGSTRASARRRCPFPMPQAGLDRTSSTSPTRACAQRATSRSRPTRCSSARTSTPSSGSSAFSAEGNLGFDALFQFSPFYFIVEISASFSVKVVRRRPVRRARPVLAGGPDAVARARHRLDLAAVLRHRRRASTSPGARRATRRCRRSPSCRSSSSELDKPDNWQAALPPGTNLLVSLRQLDPAAGELVLHPLGALRVSQRAVPLDLDARQGRHAEGRATPGAARCRSRRRGLAKRADTTEPFAPAQFQDFPDAAKLAKPAFEPGHGGIELSAAGAQLASGTAVKRVVRYELMTIDTNYRRFTAPFKRFAGSLFAHFLRGSAISRSPLSQHEETLRLPFEEKVVARADAYVVAFAADNTAYAGDAATFASEAMAHDYLAQQVGDDPALGGALHVIPAFELAA